MGEMLYLQDPEHPDERDRVMRGIEKTLAAPADAARYQLLPVANYVYNGAFWVPETVVGGGLIWTLQQIAQYAEDSTGTLEGTIAGLLNEMARGGTIMPGALSPPVVARADQDLVKAWGNWQGVPYGNDIGSIEAMVGRKYVAVDAGAYVSPVVANGGTAAAPITFTGVNLLGRISYIFNVTDRTFHRAVTVVDPAGGAVGTIVCDPPIRTASSVLRIRFASTPHAWNSATDAIQGIAVAGDPPRINGPATFVSVNAALAANFQYVLPCALYGRYQVDITWYTAGTTLVQFNIFGKYNDAAWGALNAIPPGYSQNTKFQTVAGVAFGAPPIGGGAAGLTANILCARMQDPDGFNSLAIEMNSINRDAVAVVVTGTYRLQGGTA